MSTPKSTLQPKSNATLWLLLGIVGAVAAGYFYVAPEVSELRQLRLNSQALAADRQAYELQISQVTALDTRLDAQQSVLDQLAVAIPARPAVDELIVALQAMASQSGIILSTIQPAAESSSDGVSATISARGSYSGLHLFLEELAKNQRPIKVTELALSAASDVTGASLVNASIQLVAATVGAGSGATDAHGEAAAASAESVPAASEGGTGE